MPNLHAYYYHGNIKSFRQELDASGGPSGQGGGGSGSGGGGGGGGTAKVGSAGRSWTMSGMSWNEVRKVDPNERDAFGRTVLHLAASSLTPTAYTFLTILLRHPNISVNLQDYESGYTALHRALFAGNIKAARDLLARHDIDLGVKDMEGLSAFDLYNGTVDGTSPPRDVDGTDLYVWGVNRNFALGTGDSSDKAYADRVNLLTQQQASGKADPTQRFFHVGVKDVVMSKLHTAAVTNEARGNLSICGFGSNGRLGRTVHSQLALTPMSDFPHSITAVALGLDHTLALTSGGYILSWGQNRFSQLGYVIEQPEKLVGMGKDDVEVQVSPKRIVGSLKKEFVKGVAASRMASACWTADSLFTWGTNAGHLGYDKATNPVQSSPRKVTTISQPVIDVALSEYAMICLLDSFEVLCFHRDAYFKIAFSTPRILSDAFPFRPPQSTLKPMIKKVTSCGPTFAALSSIGDVFTFQLPNPLEDISKDARDRHVTVKPQLIWALRKRFTAVEDVALGLDGTVIICTSSGHVFVRQRVKSGAGQLKFRQIPYLQRIVKVATNESGAFAAIRVDARAAPITLTGKTLEEDFFSLQPHFRRFENQMTSEDFDREKNKHAMDDDEEDEGSNSVTHDTAVAVRMCTILARWKASDAESLFSWSDPLLGSDLSLLIGDMTIPVHSTILCLRSPAFGRLLSGSKLDGFQRRSAGDWLIVEVTACHPLVVLLLLQYIYSDDIAALWDARVTRTIQDKFKSLKLPIADIKADLQRLADILELAPLASILQSTAKTPNPKRTLKTDLLSFFSKTYPTSPPPPSCDTTLVLADKEVNCSSVILRSRCPFFEAMFADSDWTSARQGDDGRVTISMEHLKWTPMKLVFKFIHGAQEEDLFDYLHQETLDEFLDFVFEVLAAATELLIDRLVLICSRVVIRHCNAFNAAALAAEAAFYQATTLKLSIFDYIIASMETMLESGLLDEMDTDVLQELCDVIAQKQSQKLFVPRMGLAVIPLMEKHKEWLSQQDIPVPRVRQPYKFRARSPKLSPVESFTPAKESRRSRVPTTNSATPIGSPEVQPLSTPLAAADDIFTMDEDQMTPPSSASGVQTPRSGRPMTPLDLASGSSKPVWKSKKVEAEKVDLRSIMAETAAAKTPTRPSVTSTPSSLLGRAQAPSSLTPGASTPWGSSGRKPVSGDRSPATTASTPWKSVDVQRPSLSAVQASQSSPSSSSSYPNTSAAIRTAASQTTPISQRTISAKGFTPAKPPPSATATAGPSIIRKASGGPAWASTTSFAPPPPVSISPTVQSFSLLAIQQAEQDLLERSKKPVMRSFTDIQEEEQKKVKEKAAEADFMRWWQEEEAKASTGPGKSPARNRGGGGGGKAKSAGGEGKSKKGMDGIGAAKAHPAATSREKGADGSRSKAEDGSHLKSTALDDPVTGRNTPGQGQAGKGGRGSRGGGGGGRGGQSRQAQPRRGGGPGSGPGPAVGQTQRQAQTTGTGQSVDEQRGIPAAPAQPAKKPPTGPRNALEAPGSSTLGGKGGPSLAAHVGAAEFVPKGFGA